MAEFQITEVLPSAEIAGGFLTIPLDELEAKVTDLGLSGVSFDASSNLLNFERIYIALLYILSDKLTAEYRSQDPVNRQLEIIRSAISSFLTTDDSGNFYQSMEFTSTFYRAFQIPAFSPEDF
ncbi:MAG TPA: hypothetical protein DEP38_15330 [Cyanobacteria bacterium UBA9226]|nr:hypothetical protein [Cyanobacteria bacterium UBA9226]